MSLPKAKALARRLRDVVQGAKRLQVDGQMAQDAVYELYVAVRAVEDVRRSYEVRLVQTRAAGQVRFPLNAADKANYSYFEVWGRGLLQFQICLGTRYWNANGTSFAPDLSVQVANSPAKPMATDVVFCWDCKFHSDASKRLPRNEVAVVAAWTSCNLRPTAQALPFSVFSAGAIWPQSNAVITNRRNSSLKPNDLIALEINEVSDLRPGSKPVCRP